MCNELSESSISLCGNSRSIISDDYWFNTYYAGRINQYPDFIDVWLSSFGLPPDSHDRNYFKRMAYAFHGWELAMTGEIRTLTQSIEVDPDTLDVKGNVEVNEVHTDLKARKGSLGWSEVPEGKYNIDLGFYGDEAGEKILIHNSNENEKQNSDG